MSRIYVLQVLRVWPTDVCFTTTIFKNYASKIKHIKIYATQCFSFKNIIQKFVYQKLYFRNLSSNKLYSKKLPWKILKISYIKKSFNKKNFSTKIFTKIILVTFRLVIHYHLLLLFAVICFSTVNYIYLLKNFHAKTLKIYLESSAIYLTAFLFFSQFSETKSLKFYSVIFYATRFKVNFQAHLLKHNTLLIKLFSSNNFIFYHGS